MTVAPATGPMYDEGTKFIWMMQTAELRGVARCMAAAGYHVTSWPAPFNSATFADNSQMPDLPRIARTHEFVPAGGISPSRSSKAEQKASITCWSRAAAPFLPLMQVYRKLTGSWWGIVFRIQASARVNAAIPALNRCATRYGFPYDPYGNASAPIRTFANFMDWVAGHLDGAGSRGASQSTMRALDRHWTGVFVTCARPIVGVFQRLQMAARAGFLHRNAIQIRQLDQIAWRMLGDHDVSAGGS
jgi:hypothetical protein